MARLPLVDRPPGRRDYSGAAMPLDFRLVRLGDRTMLNALSHRAIELCDKAFSDRFRFVDHSFLILTRHAVAIAEELQRCGFTVVWE